MSFSNHLKLTVAVTIFLVSTSVFASSDESELSPAMQIAKRVALTHNTRELPSRGYQLSSFAVKRSKDLQAVKMPKTNKRAKPSSY